jgi:hypothetical protein
METWKQYTCQYFVVKIDAIGRLPHRICDRRRKLAPGWCGNSVSESCNRVSPLLARFLHHSGCHENRGHDKRSILLLVVVTCSETQSLKIESHCHACMLLSIRSMQAFFYA